jgi:hypothetical protein
MRPKFVIAVLSVTALLVAAMFYAKHRVDHSKPPSQPATPVAAAQPAAATPVHNTPIPTVVPAPVLPVAPRDLNAEGVEAEVDRLYELAATGDPASVPTILLDLNYPDKEVRMAAVTALRECGDASVVPALMSAANATDDIEEKMEYLQAAEMLSVPNMEFNGKPVALTPEQIKIRNERRARRDALHEAMAPKLPGATGPAGATPTQ